MRPRSNTNSRPHEDLPLRRTYHTANPWCEYCVPLMGVSKFRRDTATEVDHIMQAGRYDVITNLIACCHDCHRRKHELGASGKILGLWVKHTKGELHPEELSRLMRRPLLGWLEVERDKLPKGDWAEIMATEILEGADDG